MTRSRPRGDGWRRAIRDRPARALPVLTRLGPLAAALALSAASCANPDGERREPTTRATYDERTGRLQELAHDSTGSGRIDTWTDMDGARPVRASIDSNEDGRIDRWEYYDEQGQLARVGFSRADDGVPDAWAYPGPGGLIERVEISSARDEERIDRWERYDPRFPGEDGRGVLVAVDEDTSGDGRPDKWETYDAGVLTAVAFDETGDGRPDRRLVYEDGALVRIEAEPDGTGRFTARVPVD